MVSADSPDSQLLTVWQLTTIWADGPTADSHQTVQQAQTVWQDSLLLDGWQSDFQLVSSWL